MDTAAQHKAEPKNDNPEAGKPASQATAVGTMSETTAKMTLSAPTDNSDLQDESDNTPADRFEVKKYQAVGIWAWDMKIDTCAICHSHIMEKCIECEASDSKEPCVPGWGACGHCYHFHCISRWLKTRQVCPLDNQEWNWGKLGS